MSFALCFWIYNWSNSDQSCEMEYMSYVWIFKKNSTIALELEHKSTQRALGLSHWIVAYLYSCCWRRNSCCCACCCCCWKLWLCPPWGCPGRLPDCPGCPNCDQKFRSIYYLELYGTYYLAYSPQQPIPKLWILNNHDFFLINQIVSDRKKIVSQNLFWWLDRKLGFVFRGFGICCCVSWKRSTARTINDVVFLRMLQVQHG